MDIFNEVNRNGRLRVGHQGNKNILSTVPLSLDPNNRGGIAPLNFPSGLDLFKTTAGIIKQGEASNLHKDQLPYPINNVILDLPQSEQITDELVFVKPDQPAPPRQYSEMSNHELEMMLQTYPDGTPKHISVPDKIHIREGLYKTHLSMLKDIEKIPDEEVKQTRMKRELERLLLSDPELYSAMYNRAIAVKDEVVQDVIQEQPEEKSKDEAVKEVVRHLQTIIEEKVEEEKSPKTSTDTTKDSDFKSISASPPLSDIQNFDDFMDMLEVSKQSDIDELLITAKAYHQDNEKIPANLSKPQKQARREAMAVYAFIEEYTKSYGKVPSKKIIQDNTQLILNAVSGTGKANTTNYNTIRKNIKKEL